MKGKKLLSVMLSALMIQSIAVISTISTSAVEVQPNALQAEKLTETGENEYSCNGYDYNIIDEEVTIIDYTGTETELTIPSEIDGYAVTAIGEYAFDGNCDITTVTIPNSVETIGQKAFYGCQSITKLELGNGVNSIISGAFAKCKNLTSVTIPNSVKFIGDCSFYECYNITSVTIGNSVEHMGDYVFYDCRSLEKVTIAKGTTELGRFTFRFCTSLTSVIMPDTITKIGDGAFQWCKSLKYAPNLIAVKEIGENAFEGCTSLTNIRIPKNIKTIKREAFSYCNGIKLLSLENGITSIGIKAFYRCNSLTDVTIPNSVRSIGIGCFEECANLKTVTISIGSSLTSMGLRAFATCKNLEKVTIERGVTEISQKAFSDCTLLKEIYIPDTVTKIGNIDVNSSNLKDTYVFRKHSPDLTIYGSSNSLAQKFANANNINFTVVDTPINEGVKIVGDIDLELQETYPDIYTGTAYLQDDTYLFNIDDKGAIRGFNYEYNNVAAIDYSAGYKAPTTFNTTISGRYTFTYNASTNILKIKQKPFTEIVELFGDINIELVRSASNLSTFTGSARIDAGSYNFMISDQGNEMSFGYSFDDVIYDVEYKKNYTKPTTFNATGGIYSIIYNIYTNKLTIQHAPKGLGDVIIFGDINLPLASHGNNIYSGTKIVEPGIYHFRIDSLGKTLCNGSEFTNGMSDVIYEADWKAATSLKVTDKQRCTFIYDANTNMLNVFNSPIDTKKVLVAFDNSKLELTSTDSVNYTATKSLEAGTYSFRMDEFGVTMGYGGNYSDNIVGIKYNSRYLSATIFKATGGDYKFSYNVKTDVLNVTKIYS